MCSCFAYELFLWVDCFFFFLCLFCGEGGGMGGIFISCACFEGGVHFVCEWEI